jgi:Carboxypeptidase regulatory-like domain
MRRLGLSLLAALLLLGGSFAFAQGKKKGEEQNRSVQGVVTSGNDQVVPGAVVYLKNTKTLEIRTFITKEDGSYNFQRLSPDIDYELKAELQSQGESSSTKTLSSFDSRKQATINLKLNPKK